MTDMITIFEDSNIRERVKNINIPNSVWPQRAQQRGAWGLSWWGYVAKISSHSKPAENFASMIFFALCKQMAILSKMTFSAFKGLYSTIYTCLYLSAVTLLIRTFVFFCVR